MIIKMGVDLLPDMLINNKSMRVKIGSKGSKWPGNWTA
jgi:hypothetical protein